MQFTPEERRKTREQRDVSCGGEYAGCPDRASDLSAWAASLKIMLEAGRQHRERPRLPGCEPGCGFYPCLCCSPGPPPWAGAQPPCGRALVPEDELLPHSQSRRFKRRGDWLGPLPQRHCSKGNGGGELGPWDTSFAHSTSSPVPQAAPGDKGPGKEVWSGYERRG